MTSPDAAGFSTANLPYGAFSTPDDPTDVRLGVAIEGSILDLRAVSQRGLLPSDVTPLVTGRRLDPLLAAEPDVWRSLRSRLVSLLGDGPAGRRTIEPLLFDRATAVMHLPFTVNDYVDFYSSIEHATNLGRLMRPDGDPLLPNWRHLPVGYHGRSSTVVVSGTPVRRPLGQTRAPDAANPTFGPCRLLDFELEVGFVTGGRPNAHGEPIPIDDAETRIFGLVLVNDWSARDVQAWEYQPLGPFLAKSFATSISPWVVPLDALAPHRVPAPAQEPDPLPYLRAARRLGLDLELEVEVAGTVVSRTNFRHMYWTMAQQLAHMASNGTVVRPGDLYASGTVSGPDRGSEGSLIEITRRGADPIALDDDSTRTFLEDGDHVVIRGWCGRESDDGDGPPVVSFGSVDGTVVPAPAAAPGGGS
ncbi:MAG TPA: fumarylacetoacetase [Acidimicrobiales bacterium]